MLCAGALIESNLVLIPRDFLHALKSPESIALYTGRKYTSRLPTLFPPVHSNIASIIDIPETERFVILVVSTYTRH